MPSPVVIVHGWSDSAKSFDHLADFLRAELAADVTTLDLADWVSLDDEITYRDLRFAMQRAWTEHPSLKNATRARIVSHSTGALVVRDWMTHFHDPADCPIERHIMLAPANFGSPLAHKGKAWYGRAVKGRRTGFQTGTHLLDGLELGSSYTWDLAERDLFGSQNWYGPSGAVMACVFVGNSGYGGIKSIVDEVGSDGTVRISTANLNAQRMELHFSADGGAPQLQIRRPTGTTFIGFGISDGDNHSSIAFKNKKRGEYQPAGPHVAQWLKKAMTVKRSGWGDFLKELKKGEELTAHSAALNEYFFRYQHVVVRLRDELDNPVEDYILEFNQGRGSFLGRVFNSFSFQRKVVEGVHPFSKDSSMRAFYLDTTTLREALGDGDVYLELDPMPAFKRGNAVGYPDLGRVTIPKERFHEILPGHGTTLLDIRIPRTVHPKAFRLLPHSRA